jgi:hypothetical protein
LAPCLDQCTGGCVIWMQTLGCANLLQRAANGQSGCFALRSNTFGEAEIVECRRPLHTIEVVLGGCCESCKILGLYGTESPCVRYSSLEGRAPNKSIPDFSLWVWNCLCSSGPTVFWDRPRGCRIHTTGMGRQHRIPQWYNGRTTGYPQSVCGRGDNRRDPVRTGPRLARSWEWALTRLAGEIDACDDSGERSSSVGCIS